MILKNLDMMKGLRLYIMNLRKPTFNQAIVLTIVFLCLITVLFQGTALSSGLSGSVVITGGILIFLFTVLILFLLFKKNKLKEETVVFAIIFAGMIFHCCYVLLTGLYERQHDEGAYTGIASSQVNPGHLGYIEYIYKFRKLPDMNPYELFSYYHPPLHHGLSGLWLILLTSLGMPEELAFENLQALPLFYSGLLMLITYLILKKTGAKGRALYTGMILIAMHPTLTLMSASINNDMLSTLLLACCILSTLCFIRERSLKNLMWIALSVGVGMLCKINTAVMAFPIGLVFMTDFIEVIRSRDRQAVIGRIKNYILFGFTAAIIGLSWIARNLIRFHEKPGISSATEASVMYTGNYSVWERLGIPAMTDWHFDFPFHPLSGDVIHNTWVIMFQTSLFGEIYPIELEGISLVLCRVVYIIAIIFALLSVILFVYTQYRKLRSPVRTNMTDALFLTSGYLIFLLSLAAFALKYPYTCSSDFRYIVICLVYIAVGMADSADENFSGGAKAITMPRIIRIGVCVSLILTTIIYMILLCCDMI